MTTLTPRNNNSKVDTTNLRKVPVPSELRSSQHTGNTQVVSSVSHGASMILSLALPLLWVYALSSWCMCFYVLFASCEGVRWFSILRNPLLIAGAVGGLVTAAWQFSAPPCSSVVITCLGWTAYSALVTMQHGKFLLWSRHILPVNAPTVVLLWWFSQSC